MNATIMIFLLTIFLTSCGNRIAQRNKLSKNDTFYIVLRTELSAPEIDPETGEVYTTEIPGEIGHDINKLEAPLKAIAALYSAIGGTMCNGEYCDLTTALGLGKQGSIKHKRLIKKYFPNDKVAATVLKQDCYLRPSGASSFSDFEYLNLSCKGDTVLVNYNLVVFNRGEIKIFKGPDIYLLKNNQFEILRRNQ